MSERSEPTTGAGRDAGAEQNSRHDGRESAPPWARGSASGGGNEAGLDVGRPLHGTGQEGDGPAAGGTGEPDEDPTAAWRYASYRDTADAPTGFVAAVPPSSGDPYTGATRTFDPPTVRTEKPMFENSAQQESSSLSAPRPPRVPRRASLQLKRLDPWSVLKLSLVLSVAGFLVWLVAVGVLYGVLDGMGVWDQINGTYSDLTSVNDPTTGGPLISAGRVFGVAALVGAVNIVLFTALATVSSLMYNVAADLVGGAELTLSERD